MHSLNNNKVSFEQLAAGENGNESRVEGVYVREIINIYSVNAKAGGFLKWKRARGSKGR